MFFPVVVPRAHDGRVAASIGFFGGLAIRVDVLGVAAAVAAAAAQDLCLTPEKVEQEIVWTRSDGIEMDRFLFQERLELLFAFAVRGGVVSKVLVNSWAVHNH